MSGVLDKTKIRKIIRRKCRQIDHEESSWLGGLMASHFKKNFQVLPGQSFGLFASDATEIFTRPLFDHLRKSGASVFFPRVEGESLRFYWVKSWNQLEEGPYGILAPVFGQEVSASELDVLFLPGVAFGLGGARLGRGGGFYDRLLHRKQLQRLIGIAYEFQYIDEVPTELHDQKVHALVTDSRYRSFAKSSRMKTVHVESVLK